MSRGMLLKNQEVGFTHKGWVLSCPVYCGNDGGEMAIAARYKLDWWLHLNLKVLHRVINPVALLLNIPNRWFLISRKPMRKVICMKV